MYIFLILGAIALGGSIVALFASPRHKELEYMMSTSGIILFIGGFLSLILNVIIAANTEQVVVSTSIYPIAKIEGYEKYAFVKHNNQFTDISLTYISEDQPVSITDRLYSVKIYDLEPGEKPSVVIKQSKIIDSNWTLFSWDTKSQEIHINQDQIGVIYEKQKKPKVEKE